MKPLPLVACLLLAIAGVLFLRGKDETTPGLPGAPARLRDHGPRGTSVGDLMSRSARLGQDERKGWIRALSDTDLQRLTRVMIADYLAACSDAAGRTNADLIRPLTNRKKYPEEELRNSMIPLLALLAMESGRRDADAFLVEATKLCDGHPLKYPYVFTSLQCAAAVGLAEIDAPRAWSFLAESGDSISPYLASLPPAVEVIFREWAKTDPETAWESVTSVSPVFLAPAIRGQLAETTDPALRASILDWVREKTRAPVSVPTPGDNRINPDLVKVCAALGLAEQDPEAAWEWIRSNASPDGDKLSVPFLRLWARRKPEETLGLWKQHAETLSPDHYSAIATGLCSRDPIAALEIYSDQTHFPEVGARSVSLLGWVSSLSAIAPSHAWPLLPEADEALSPAQSLTIISQNLHMLKLPPGSEAQARHLIERQLDQLPTR